MEEVGVEDGESDGGAEEDIWWYICTICDRAFNEITRLRVHKRRWHTADKSKGVGVQILRQAVDLAPVVKLARSTPDPAPKTQDPSSLTSGESGDSDYDNRREEDQEEEYNSGCDLDLEIKSEWEKVDRKPLKSEEHLRTHLRETHPEVRRFKCEKCVASFKFKSHLEGHQARHSEERPFACPSCCPDKKFKTKNSLQNHIRASHRPHACRMCPDKFAGQPLRDKHEFEAHGCKRGREAFTCEHDGCGKTFRAARQLKRHRFAHLIEQNFTCEKCGKGFKTQGVLDIHMHTHVPLDERSFACHVQGCGLRFKFPASLTRHKKHVHDGQVKTCPPCPCKVCGLEFPTKANAMSHELRVHNFQRPEGQVVECGTCGKKFPQPCLLRRHELSHGDLRGNVCEICGKGFKRKSALRSHQMTHVPCEDLPHFCNVCGKRFGRALQLRGHKQRIHGVGTKKRAKAKQDDSEAETDEDASQSEHEHTD